MRSLTATIACAVGAALFAPAVLADLRLGVNDDTGKYENGGSQFFSTMASLGLQENVVTIHWDPERPQADQLERRLLARALPVAAAQGVEVVLNVYPKKARAFATDPTAPAAFAAFVRGLKESFPTVKQFIVMNECNQPRFFQPQFIGSTIVSAAVCGQALALAYDALKALDADTFVWGIGLSPRGNDNPKARSNVSTSPVRFLAALGRWYRSTGRTLPLMDGFAFHPYPNANTDPVSRGYPWPKIGVVNFDRLYQAWWDAFHDTDQPTFAEWAPGGDSTLRLSLNEVGVQVETGYATGYSGNENIPAVGLDDQAHWYAELIKRAACDPHVSSLNLFHLVDEPDRAGFQSGLYGLGYARRPAAEVVRRASRNCKGSIQRWRHTEQVIGARAAFVGRDGWSIRLTAKEDVEYTIGVFPVGQVGVSNSEIGRALASDGSSLRSVSGSSGRVRAYWPRETSGRLPRGRYQVGVLMRATLNHERTSTFASPVFRVGESVSRTPPVRSVH
jgi:hypothetical protein